MVIIIKMRTSSNVIKTGDGGLNYKRKLKGHNSHGFEDELFEHISFAAISPMDISRKARKPPWKQEDHEKVCENKKMINITV